MEPAEFERYARRTRLKGRGLEVARAVLVEGRPQSDVAREHGTSKQSVYQSVRAITRLIRFARGSRKKPPGWITVTVIVPPAMAKEIKRQADDVMLNRPPLMGGRKPKGGRRPVAQAAPKTPAAAPDVAGAAALAGQLLRGLIPPPKA
ncbi:MAG: TrfB-related DNA-binding protein [Bradyrhizobium sp.]|uniref:TrfB-related DNA-binding protein n=1 Tax=Bradyrhizobium sp. TaxID=376 RepID=UPI003D134C14